MSPWLSLLAYFLICTFLAGVVVALLDRSERPRQVRSSDLKRDLGEHRWLYALGTVSALTGLTLVLRVGGDWGNIGGELLGISITVIVIAFLNRQAERKRTKRDLVFRMGSPVRDIAITAVQELKRRGMLDDGSLKQAWLRGANLEGANLPYANLAGADLRLANLRAVRFWTVVRAEQGDDRWWMIGGSNLEKADLRGADLTGAELRLANLTDAKLGTFDFGLKPEDEASLREYLRASKLGEEQERFLRTTDLTDADLSMAQLDGADLSHAQGLTQKQVDAALGNAATKLPKDLAIPQHWTHQTEPKM